jgi:hypothetical protein
METAEMETRVKGLEININYPQSAERHLHIAVGACRLKIMPGDIETWVTGNYYGPIEALPLDISQMGGEVRITQRQDWAAITRLLDGPPVLELTLGKATPYSLTIETGASENILDLGGLPLRRLAIRQGAGKIEINFSAPNPMQMDRLTSSSGASGIEMSNLANANFSDMIVEGGAVAFKLDFGGTLRQDAHVRVSSAMSSTDIIIPTTTAGKVTSHTVMGGVNVGNEFTKRDDTYWTQAAMQGAQPTLFIQATVTMGALNLHGW